MKLIQYLYSKHLYLLCNRYLKGSITNTFTKEWRPDKGLRLTWSGSKKEFSIQIEPNLKESFWFAFNMRNEGIKQKRGYLQFKKGFIRWICHEANLLF